MYYLNLFMVISIATIFSCESDTLQDGKIEVVDVEQFAKLMSVDHQLIDVRTPKEFSAGYIADAKNINYQDETFEKQIMTLDISKPVLVYCKSGGRSAKSAAVFSKKGFKKVYDLKGGFTAWSKAGKVISK